MKCESLSIQIEIIHSHGKELGKELFVKVKKKLNAPFPVSLDNLARIILDHHKSKILIKHIINKLGFCSSLITQSTKKKDLVNTINPRQHYNAHLSHAQKNLCFGQMKRHQKSYT